MKNRRAFRGHGQSGIICTKECREIEALELACDDLLPCVSGGTYVKKSSGAVSVWSVSPKFPSD